MEGFNIVSFLDKKRRNRPVSEAEISAFVQGVVSRSIPEYQTTAFLMAVAINGLSDEETTWLTKSMASSGAVYRIPDKGDKILVDKHSSGGIGDKSTLLLAPILASVGLRVFKASGRGLGFTGGTLDKLASVGVKTDLTLEEAKKVLDSCGIVILSQSSDISPADKILYALRDVTATVESSPLIASSIMSKKMAFEVDYLFLDVKYGSGAFCKTFDIAKELASIMYSIGKLAGMKVFVHITSMQQPLGYAIGNALEVLEVRKFFKGEWKSPDLQEYVITFAADILVATGKSTSDAEARSRVSEIISSGEALKALDRWFEAQGANMKMMEDDSYFKPQYEREVVSREDGYFSVKNNEDMGHISNRLGAGRLKVEDDVDFHAGIFVHRKWNDQVKKGDVLYTLYSSKPIEDSVEASILGNTQILPSPGKVDPLVVKYD